MMGTIGEFLVWYSSMIISRVGLRKIKYMYCTKHVFLAGRAGTNLSVFVRLLWIPLGGRLSVGYKID